MAQWMFYSVLTSLAIAGTAWSLDTGFRLFRRSTRWLWMGALGLSLLLPVLPRLGPGPFSWLLARTGAGAGVTLGDLVVMSTAPAVLATDALAAPPDAGLILFWVAGTVLALIATAGSLWLLSRRKRTWSPALVAGEEVWLSSTTGPAVVGLRRPRIVIPRSFLGLPRHELDLVLRHEISHRDSGDTWLLTAGLLAVALAPWNLPLWWQLRRLRLAVECDCDRRVLRSGVSLDAYGALLMRVGAQRTNSWAGLSAAALIEGPSLLELRLRAMTQRVGKGRTRMAVALGAVSAVLLGMACEVQVFTPSQVDPTEPETAVAPDAPTPPVVGVKREKPAAPQIPIPAPSTERAADIGERPTFTPFAVAPGIKNVRAVQEALERAYPATLRAAGVGGTVKVWFFIDVKGKVQHTRIQEGSGHEALDAAALSVADRFEFSPALNREEPVPVWVAFPITFRTR